MEVCCSKKSNAVAKTLSYGRILTTNFKTLMPNKCRIFVKPTFEIVTTA